MATTGLSMAEHAQAVTDPAEAGRVIARQHHVGSLVQQDLHSPVAALGDAADIVDLPGLEVPRHQAEISSHIARSAEPLRRIDSGDKGQCG